MNIKNLIKTISFSLVFVITFLILGKLFEPKWNYYGNQAQTRVQAFYRQEENTHDVLYMGASFTYCGVSPLTIYKEQGITGYVFSNPAQKAWISRAYLEEAFKTQSPKVVVYEVGPIFEEEDADEGHNRKNIDYMKWSKTKWNAIRDIVSHTSEGYKDYLFPFLRFHSRWSDLTKADFNIFYDKNYYLMGTALKMTTRAASDEKIAKYQALEPSGEESRIGERAATAVLGMKKLCEENGAQLQLVRMASMEWSTEKTAAVRAFAKENDIPFVDMNEEQDAVGIDWKTDSHDAGQHVNILGCVKTSSWLGNYLKDNYSFETKLSDSARKQWDKASEKFDNLVQAYSMPIVNDLSSYVNAMTDDEFITVIALNGKAGDCLTDAQRSALYECGIEIPEAGENTAYIAVLDGSEVVQEKTGEEITELKGFSHKNITIDAKSDVSEEDAKASIKIDGKEYALDTPGLNIVLYDKTLGQPTDAVTFDTTAEGVPAEHNTQPLVEDEGGE